MQLRFDSLCISVFLWWFHLNLVVKLKGLSLNIRGNTWKFPKFSFSGIEMEKCLDSQDTTTPFFWRTGDTFRETDIGGKSYLLLFLLSFFRELFFPLSFRPFCPFFDVEFPMRKQMKIRRNLHPSCSHNMAESSVFLPNFIPQFCYCWVWSDVLLVVLFTG